MVRLPLLPRGLRITLLFLIAGLIFVYSIIPLPRLFFELGPLGLLPIRSYLHFFVYIGFTASLVYVFADAPYSNTHILLGVFGIAVTFGLGMEIIQLGLPHRHFSYSDIGMNAVGTALAVVLSRHLLVRDTEQQSTAKT